MDVRKNYKVSMGSIAKGLRQQAAKAKETEERLYAVFNSAQEAIEVADKDGILIYLNKAFTDVTGILPDKRLGVSVFDVSPDGALAEVLRTKKSVFGKMMVTETGVDVMCNASPIIVDGVMTGAVVVFQDISDIKRLARRLDENRAELDNLKKGFNDLAAARYTFGDMVGQDPELLRCIDLAKKVARNSSTVLITGESGTGKEVLAHAIHNYGFRADKPFIKVNCAAIPTQLLESELFGFEKGAFTGANTTKIGKFELANEGTILLDEIGDMALPLQAKILRVIQEKEIERLGSSKPRLIDVQIIAATNANLLEGIQKGAFRQDLYYRLNVIPLRLPPLRERRQDILLLADEILKKKNRRYNKNCALNSQALQKLVDYDWPGNIRELENVLERAVLIADQNQIIGSDMLFIYPSANRIEPEKDNAISLAVGEKALIERSLQLYGTDMLGKRQAAEKLDISLSTLYNKMKKYGISSGYKNNSKNRK